MLSKKQRKSSPILPSQLANYKKFGIRNYGISNKMIFIDETSQENRMNKVMFRQFFQEDIDPRMGISLIGEGS
jgi:hypothetical protein